MKKQYTFSSEKKTNQLLDTLVTQGSLTSYSYSKEYEEPGRDMRTTEKLTLVFPDGNQLTVDTFCSGCAENTSLDFSGVTE